MLNKQDLLHVQKVHSHTNSMDRFNIEYVNGLKFDIATIDNCEGSKSIIIQAFGKEFKLNSNYGIDFSKVGLGGMIDGIPLLQKFYLVFAIFNDSASELLGFGVYSLPRVSTSGLSGGTKGSYTTFTLGSSFENNAWLFSEGAKVQIYGSITSWNCGIVANIIDSKTIEILLDNNSGYGYDLLGSVYSITQTTDFKPHDILSSEQYKESILLYNNYKLITAGIKISFGNVIPNFIRVGQCFYYPYGSVLLGNTHNTRYVYDISHLVPSNCSVWTGFYGYFPQSGNYRVNQLEFPNVSAGGYLYLSENSSISSSDYLQSHYVTGFNWNGLMKNYVAGTNTEDNYLYINSFTENL